MASSSTILPLPPDVIAQIRSSKIITSLNGVIFELFKNSLDASAKNIEISVLYSRGSCTVDDDGLGIAPSEFQADGGLGKLHHSSKQNSYPPTHGAHGAFLASLAALSLVSISSRHHLYHSYNAVSLNRSEFISRMTPAPQQPQLFSVSHGTRVVVRDLFGNMPVRLKHRALAEAQHGSAREWEELRRGVAGLLLAWPTSVSVTVRDGGSDRRIRVRGGVNAGLTQQITSPTTILGIVCSILSQASFLSSPQKESWISTSASTSSIAIHGAISLVPAATKQAQFISLGIHPLENHEGYNALYDQINRQFTNSAFGNEETQIICRDERDSETDNRMNKTGGIEGSRKGVDRWPMFFVKIELLHSIIGTRSGGGQLFENFQTLNSILELLRVMIAEFLSKHHFSPKAAENLSRGPKISSTESKESLKSDHSIQVVASSGNVPVIRRASARRGENIGRHSHFDGWSRIKAGKAPPINNMVKEPGTQLKSAYLLADHRKASLADGRTRHPVCTIPVHAHWGVDSDFSTITHADVTKDMPVQFRPATDKSGMIIDRPFSDVSTSLNTTEQRILKSDAAIGNPNPKSSHCGDSFVEWVDPISKNVSVFNSRTGHAKPLRSSDTVFARSSEEKEGPQKPHSPLHEENVRKPPVNSSEFWIEEVLQKWDNPVFCPTEAPIPYLTAQIPEFEALKLRHGLRHHCSQIDKDKSLPASPAGRSGQLSKASLRLAEVVSQVDKKYILVKIPVSEGASGEGAGETLVMVDQHAADERCRIEELMASLCTKPDLSTIDLLQSTCLPGLQTSHLQKPINFDISVVEIDLLRSHIQHFANWGILYKLISSAAGPHTRVTVTHVPSSIAKRCSSDPKLLIDLIRSECWKRGERAAKALEQHTVFSMASGSDERHTWVTKIHDCPQGIIDMLNSRSCRSAIMFNDELSKTQCEALIQRLAGCAFPFQCAHGRPSMVPLASMEALSQLMGLKQQKEEELAIALSTWADSKRGIKASS